MKKVKLMLMNRFKRFCKMLFCDYWPVVDGHKTPLYFIEINKHIEENK